MTLSTGPVEGTSISTGEIHVWGAQLDSEGWPAADRLPTEDHERAARLLGSRVRDRWVAARWALREVLGRYLDEDPGAVELRIGEHGKPMLATPDLPLRFNLSHSHDQALVAVAWGREVGVDIEQIKPRGDLLALARRTFEPVEAGAIAELPAADRPAAFHAAWTRREAVAKCFGTGLVAPLPEAAEVQFAALDVAPGFAAAVAVTGMEPLSPRQFDVEPGLASKTD